jgi:hypothetical protein
VAAALRLDGGRKPGRPAALEPPPHFSAHHTVTMPSMIIFMPKPLTTICLKTKSCSAVLRPITCIVTRSEIISEQEEPQDG